LKDSYKFVLSFFFCWKWCPSLMWIELMSH